MCAAIHDETSKAPENLAAALAALDKAFGELHKLGVTGFTFTTQGQNHMVVVHDDASKLKVVKIDGKPLCCKCWCNVNSGGWYCCSPC